jgi:hypothetical protein
MLSVASCAKYELMAHQHQMREDITQNRKDLYQQSYGQIEEEYKEIE